MNMHMIWRLVNKPKTPLQRRYIGLFLGSGFSLIILYFLSLSPAEGFHQAGPINPGHENLTCTDCHKRAPGTFRQQVQANVRYTLGMRETPVDVGFASVSNEVCLDCHDRPNERHPVFRFLEPRFAEARETIAPQFCTSCHMEHEGKRVSVEPTYCQHCHEDLVLKNDPITIPHVQLVQDKRWDTCLGCHDFHGNHVMETRTDVADIIDMATIKGYFEHADNPYSKVKVFEAKK